MNLNQKERFLIRFLHLPYLSAPIDLIPKHSSTRCYPNFQATKHAPLFWSAKWERGQIRLELASRNTWQTALSSSITSCAGRQKSKPSRLGKCGAQSTR